MNNIQLNIIANAQFQQVYAEVAKLKEAMLSLQKVSVGGPFAPGVAADVKSAQQAFDNAILSTRAFTIQNVAMTDSVTKFGRQLASGQLSLNQYYKIWRDNVKGTSAELDALATSQARLNRSVAISNPLQPGYAKLVTDINGVVTAQEKAIFYQQALNTALHDGAMKLIDFGKNTQWMGRQLTVGLTMPLAMFGAAVSSQYLSFDQQMTSMLKVYGAHAVVQSQQTLDTIRKEVTDLATNLARTIGVTMTDTVEIAKTFSQIGLEGQDLIKTTQATATLMKLGDLQASNAAQSMVSLQNVFKLQSNQMQDAVNFLNAAKHSTSTSMQDIIDAIPRVGPILQQMGGTYKDFVTMLVGMRESGVPAAQAANAIKSMFASIENPTSRAVKLFDSLGISLKGIVSQDQNNPLKMVMDLQQALDKLPSLTRQQAIENLFGKFQFARVEALLSNLGKTGSQTQKVLELYGQSTDQLAAVAKQEIDVASNKTPAAQFQKMKATLQADLIPLGQTFLQSFTALGNVVDKLLKTFQSISKSLGPVAGILGKIFGGALVGTVVIGPILMLTGLFANLVGNLLKGANYFRMFKQGIDNALPSQNKFMAGIENMRNFYKDLDVGMVAARNQMELMPEAITTNAQAFDVLTSSIRALTLQFEALAMAQATAMGGKVDVSAVESLAAKVRATGVNIPGFATGDFVPGTGNSDSVLAKLTPGEFVVRKSVAQSDPSGMRALNEGKGRIIGYNGGGFVGAISEIGQLLGLRNFETTMLPRVAAAIENSTSSQLIASLESSAASLGGARVQGNRYYDATKRKTRTTGSSTRNVKESGGLSYTDLRNRTSSVYSPTLVDYGITPTAEGDVLVHAFTPQFMERISGNTSALSRQTFGEIFGNHLLNSVNSRYQNIFALPNYMVKNTESFNNSIKALTAPANRWGAAWRPTTWNDMTSLLLHLNENGYPAAQAKLIAEEASNQLNEIMLVQMRDGLPMSESLFGQASAIANRRAIAKVVGRMQVPPVTSNILSPENYTRLLDRNTMWPGYNRGGMIKARALGGPTNAGEPYIVGENGPELFVPGSSGTVLPNGSYGLGVPNYESPIGPLLENGRMSNKGNIISRAYRSYSNANMIKSGMVGMGLMMGGGFAGSAVGGTAGSAISTISQFAGMGGMFGPEGLLVGTAIGTIKTIFDYQNKSAQHTAEVWKDATTQTSEALALFNSKALDTSIKITNLSKETGTFTTSASKASAAVNQIVSSLDKLPKDDPLAKLVKEISDPSYRTSGVVGNVRKQVQTAINTGGLDPSQAKNYVQAILAKANRSSDFDTVWSEISKSIGFNEKTGQADVSKSTATGLQYLAKQVKESTTSYGFVTSGGFADKQGHLQDYKELEGAAKALADQMKNLFAITSNGSLTYDQLKSRMDGLKKSGLDSSVALEALESAIKASGNKDAITRLGQIETMIAQSGKNAKITASQIMELNAAMQIMDSNAIKDWAVKHGEPVKSTPLQWYMDYLKSPEFKKQYADYQKVQATILGGGTPPGGAGGTVDNSKAFAPIIKQYEGVKKIIDAQVAAQKKYNDELKATQDYHQKQLDYFNQMKMAYTSGNFMQAAQISQSAQSAQADFLGNQQLAKQSDLAQNMSDKIALLQAAASSNTPLSQFLKENKGFKTNLDSKSVTALLGGVTQGSYAAQTSGYVSKAISMQNQNIAEGASGPFGGMQINIYADNSVVPDQFANKVTGAVQAALAKSSAKGKTSNKITAQSTARSPKVVHK